MSSLLKSFVTFAFVCALALPGQAQDGTPKKKKAKDEIKGPAATAFQLPKEIELTDEQKSKIDSLKKELGPDLVKLHRKQGDIHTPEQQAARKAAQEKNKADGVKGKAAKAAVDSAVNLTPEQQKQWDDTQKEITAHRGKIQEKLHPILTDDQKAKLKQARGKKKAAN